MSEPITLYYFPASFYSQRGYFGLAEKGVPYRKHVIAMHSGEHVEPWFLRIQPKGTVPAIIHGNVIKTDSRDIILYMDELVPDAPKFLPDPSTPEGERVSHFLELMQPIPVGNITYGSGCNRQHTQDCMIPKSLMGGAQAATKMASDSEANMRKLANEHPEFRQQLLEKIKISEERELSSEDKLLAALYECDKIFAEIEDELAKRWQGKLANFSEDDPWLCCNHFTIADIYLATLLHRLVFVGQAKRFWADGKRPYIAAYYARVQLRESFKTACGDANNVFKSMMLPKIKYQIRKAMPRFTGVAMVAAVVGFGIYVRYNGFPSWWPENLKLEI